MAAACAGGGTGPWQVRLSEREEEREADDGDADDGVVMLVTSARHMLAGRNGLCRACSASSSWQSQRTNRKS